ncbi:SigE family RNA polymerase sigma factor [Tenggerimyces flavus]|uniref:SigE family RNA polymerase sigma factor n=1 Tax=Tenggerimyces flavus TaxID=1708749 RepID=A0ABV7YJT3_9ACTN|nr:SigE family RNA polymerase sigma factor [Tenggerimyces flavus]MBM7785886.1 RNA polymerase sigma-70 factor (sigma-E family) [Tenggerimyces flavus]
MGETGEVDFSAWVAARGPALLRFAYLVTRDRGRAEEAVQSALAAACPRWARIVRGGAPEAYVRRMVVNTDTTFWRRFRRREVLVSDLSPLAGAAADVSEAVVAEDFAWALVSSLPVRQRAAVVLRYYEGRTDAEIASILSCSEGTVRSQIHRALAALRSRLNSQEEAERT